MAESGISENNFKIFVVLATFASNMLVQTRTPLVTALKINMTCIVDAVLLANSTLRVPSNTHRFYRNAVPSLWFVASVI